MLRFCDFLLVGWFYCSFSGTLPGRAHGEIFTVYGSYDVFSPKDAVILRVATISEFIYGVISAILKIENTQ